MIRTLVVLFIVASFATFAAAQQTSAPADETEAVKVPLNNYLRAHATGDPAFVRRAFHPDARIMSFRNDKFNSLSVDEFAALFNGRPADDEPRRARKIEMIDISGTAAIAKIVLDYPAVRFVDYMSLLKIGGEWKIVAKSFYAEPKAQK